MWELYIKHPDKLEGCSLDKILKLHGLISKLPAPDAKILLEKAPRFADAVDQHLNEAKCRQEVDDDKLEKETEFIKNGLKDFP